MNPFQSNNIWKRAARERRKAEHPDTPEQARRRERTSTALWLAGGTVVLVLFLAALRWGVLEWSLENMAVLAIVALYTLYNAVSLGRTRREPADKDGTGK